jgi:hypothetical protein
MSTDLVTPWISDAGLVADAVSCAQKTEVQLEILTDHLQQNLLESGVAKKLVQIAIEEASRRSALTHDNRFHKFVLYKSPDERIQLRLHVWDVNALPLAGQIVPHSHRWHLISWVVCGELQHTIFQETDQIECGQESIRYRRGRPGKIGSYELVQDNVAILRIMAIERRKAGSVSFLPSGQIHRAVANGGKFTATIALTVLPSVSTGPDVCYYPKHVDRLDGDHDHRSLSEFQSRQLLSAVLDRWGS